MEHLDIETTHRASGACVLSLLGPLTLATLFDFQPAARAACAGTMILDLSGTPFMDSAGLGAVLGVYASCQRHGYGFALAGAPDRIKTLLQVTRVDGLLPSFGSVEEAERGLSAAAKA